jgi:hypothetical protein
MASMIIKILVGQSNRSLEGENRMGNATHNKTSELLVYLQSLFLFSQI